MRCNIMKKPSLTEKIRYEGDIKWQNLFVVISVEV